MAAFFQLPDRRVVPNWRDYKRTVLLGELDSIIKTKPEFNVNISKQIRDWEISNSVGTAADLLGSAYLSNEKSDIRLAEASQYILHNIEKASVPLISLAKEIINPQASDKNNPIDLIEIKDLLEINSAKSFEYVVKLIKGVKSNIKTNSHNAIWWVELSRLYSIIGQTRQALHAMQIAVNLSPNNRFVLRSATRLYIHFGEPDIALHYLRKSVKTKYDPWLLSAHIATSAILNKHQVNANTGKDMIASNNFSDFNITELSSSLGTLEFSSGAIKSSKKFFDIAQKSPNDNTLAQLEWISQKDQRFVFDQLLLSNVSNSYEAYAIEQFEKGDWVEAAKNSIKWFYDMPYSSRPVVLGSFICSAFLDDHEAAIKLCNLGTVANPNDITVINNLIYAYLLSNKVEEAVKASKSINTSRFNEVSDESVIMLQATMGLLEFRQGNIEKGKQLYQLSIQNTQIIKRKDLELLANANFLRELIMNNCPEVEGVFYSLSNINDKEMKLYVIKLKEKVMELYHSKKKI